MNKLILSLFLALNSLALSAQTDSVALYVDSCECGSKQLILDFCEEMPEPSIGWEAWDSYVKSHFRYPEKYKEQSIEGTVYVGFVVDLQGRICSAVVKKGIPGAPELDAEALRVVRESSPWKTGKMNGRSVCARINIPIKVRL